MEVDYIILGQGICGTFLSRELLRLGKKIIVIDEAQDFTASKVASGVINPVTGRKIVKTWMIDELLPFALDAYSSFGNELNARLVSECNVLDFHPTLQMKDAFAERMKEDEGYLSTIDETKWQQYFRFNYGIGEISPCLLVDLHALLNKWRKKLVEENILVEEKFDFSQLTIHDSQLTIAYKDIVAKKIICCEGVAGFNNPYFKMLPYVRTKGEALIVEINDLPRTNIYKQGISIVPWKENLFWVGSSYEWNYTDTKPTEIFRKKTEQQLTYLLKLPFKTVDHLSSERPANIERRPFIGLHPVHSSIGILNGMGTKGCSLAPYFAKELAEHFVNDLPLDPLVDVKRFARVLSR
jgi:glycine/D-amino acid oxidase-like deaminating enzyme